MILFVDPASNATGWALFGVDGVLRESGAIRVENEKEPVFDKLAALSKRYRAVFEEMDVMEAHIEQLVRNTHIAVHWSVGAIGAALAETVPRVEADIPISSWQKYAGYAKKNKKVTISGPLLEYQDAAASEDELAAIGMGLWWFSR